MNRFLAVAIGGALGDVPDHHSYVGSRKRRRRWQVRMFDVAKRGGLGEKETVILPRELHKVSAIAKKIESGRAIEMRGTFDVADDDLCHELFGRIDGSHHTRLCGLRCCGRATQLDRTRRRLL